MTKQNWPELKDVLAARQRISQYVSRTPLYRHKALDKFVGAEIYVKHENHQILGASKVRGGVNLVSQMSREELDRGLSTASSGNHGQSIAYAARLFGANAHIAVPEGANPGKVDSMRNLGAEVMHYGTHFGAANDYIQELSREKGYRLGNGETGTRGFNVGANAAIRVLDNGSSVIIDDSWLGSSRIRGV